MRIFISQPMKNKTPQEVLNQKKVIQQKIISQLRADMNESMTFIDTFISDEENVSSQYANKDLWFLARSLELLAQADRAYFPKDYASYRGCYIEYECAQKYHIPTSFYE